MSAQDTLTKQILGQGLTSRWTGEGLGSVEANAADMARMLAEAGITDIKQFGVIPVYDQLETQYWYDGKPATPVGNGMVEAMVRVPVGSTGHYGYNYETIPIERTTKVYGTPEDLSNGFSPVDTSRVKFVNGNPVLDRGQTGYGNKVTGQTITSTYNKQGGNVFGGTREGAGTTGYQVDFTPDGTPVFYTSYSSNNNAKDFLPLLAIAGLAFGAPMLGEAFGAAGAAGAGAGLGAAELAALDLALGGAGGSLGAAELGAALGTAGGVGADALSALDAGMGAYPNTGGIGLEGLDAGMNAYPSTGSGLDAGMNAYPNTGNIGSPSSIKLSDAKRALDVANKLTGGTQPVGSTKPVYDAAGKLISGGAAGTGTTAGLSGLTQGQPSVDALLNLMGSNNQLANIKSVENLFGSGIFASPEKSEPKNEGQTESSEVDKQADDVSYFGGGHVNNMDVDTLLRILRS